MQTRNQLFDDLSQLMTNAAGMAQGVREEAETAMRAAFERWLAESAIASREEVEAVREMALKTREENEALKARLETLEAQLASKA
ncbi:MAG: accessory factor UbiK family protein [Pseudomonadota bacterium]